MFPIGDRGIGGPGCAFVCTLVRLGGVDCFLPCDLPVFAVNGQNGELQFLKWVQIVVGTGGLPWHRKLFAHWNGGCQVNMITPHDGRGMAKTGQGGFPAEVFGFTPFNGRVRVRCVAGGQRAAPLAPVLMGLGVFCTKANRSRCYEGTK